MMYCFYLKLTIPIDLDDQFYAIMIVKKGFISQKNLKWNAKKLNSDTSVIINLMI